MFVNILRLRYTTRRRSAFSSLASSEATRGVRGAKRCASVKAGPLGTGTRNPKRSRRLQSCAGRAMTEYGLAKSSNNAFERPSGPRGRAVLAIDCVLGGAERAPCLAAQLGR